ncbi:MAG: transglutaminase family protein [Pseudomonadales bacterium]|nr:transglutaminase family protein [Pseudomonadales bacterium]
MDNDKNKGAQLDPHHKYLESSTHIDWRTPEVFAKAKELESTIGSFQETARNCFEFVRDEIKHSLDFKSNPVTCTASDVLRNETGYCYAKSHLLAALLRANQIPSGLCYQRLTVSNDEPPFCIHGLNAVFLEPYGWYRIDARGNKEGVLAEFTPPVEKLAYPIVSDGEADVPGIHSEPLSAVVELLSSCKTYDEVARNLPDILIEP